MSKIEIIDSGIIKTDVLTIKGEKWIPQEAAQEMARLAFTNGKNSMKISNLELSVDEAWESNR